MRSGATASGEILRGMDVEAVCLALPRRPTPARENPGPPAPAEPTADDRALAERLAQAEQLGHQQGTRSGYEEGLRKGLADAAMQVQSAVDKERDAAARTLRQEKERLAAAAGAIERAMGDLLSAAEEEMVALCFETVCRIVAETAVQPEMVRAHLSAVASRASAGERVALHVHPEDATLLTAAGVDVGVAAEVRWVADPEVAYGGCLVRSAAGGLDARLETTLGACKSALLAARARRSAMPQSAGRGLAS